ncbi:MAG: response regulator [Sulfuritalea sp.]|jgi:two-component system cell cycle response regulator DivK|nr:response regulator [Sulfuritalea sp.]
MARILVIEDNATNMKLAVLMLQREGYEILQAADAEEGIRLARAELPDLILMDVQLPGMDGLAATRLLKGDAATNKIRIVALTALAMSGDREKIEAAGCDGYIAKPIHYQEFLKTVGQMVAGDTYDFPSGPH